MNLFDDIKISDLPSKIDNNNILKAIIEIRFTSDKHTEMVVWPLYDVLKDEYDSPQITPFGRVPREVRSANSEFLGQILYTMTSKNLMYKIGVGDGVFSVELGNFKYDTWIDFVDEFGKICEIIQQSINVIARIGVRYINIFDEKKSDVENFTFEFKLRNKNLFNYPMQCVFEFPIDERNARISVVNNVKYKYLCDDKTECAGENATAIDIDVIYSKNTNKTDIIEVINRSHIAVKKIFFGMCADKFKKQVLKPQKEEV